MPYRLIVVGLTAALSVSSLPAQVSGDSALVARAHVDWFTGLLAADTIKLSRVLDTSITLGFPGGNLFPRGLYLEGLADGTIQYDSAAHERVSIRVFARSAVVVGRSTLTYRYQQRPGRERLAYTATYVRFGGDWRMVAWQSTAIAPPPP